MDKINFKRFLLNRKESVNENLKDFIEEFNKNPKQALIWSSNTFKEAVLNREIENLLENYKTIDIDHVKKYYLDRILSTSKFLSNKSTSQTRNLIQEYELEVYAELYTILTN